MVALVLSRGTTTKNSVVGGGGGAVLQILVILFQTIQRDSLRSRIVFHVACSRRSESGARAKNKPSERAGKTAAWKTRSRMTHDDDQSLSCACAIVSSRRSCAAL